MTIERMPYMYILECCDGSYYVGSTWSLNARLDDHCAGFGSEYTKTRLPVKLVYYEWWDRIADAHAREKQVQNWSRAKRRALIQGRFDRLPRLSAKPTAPSND
jgi:putative endonuclease